MRIAVLSVLLAAAWPLCAQIDNGNISGRVTDPTGAVVAGAQVTLLRTETNTESVATTNAAGIYRALNLRPGLYRLTVVAPGFKKRVADNIELRINSTLAVDMPLELGVVTDRVEVSASSQLLDTETSSSGTTMAGDYFYNLPNYQRHASAVLLFTPGVTFSANQYTKSLSGMTINGLGSGVMGYFEDGTLATMGARGDNSETVDNSIEEIKVFTSAMPAEYGHSGGVGISIVKKSGTNQLHGEITEQVRTRSMQQRRFFEQYRNSQIQP
ncbi:MAG: carboxypeptidase-like regulatory domain-containing protein, partial [Terriglobia bacterium]